MVVDFGGRVRRDETSGLGRLVRFYKIIES